MSESYPFRRIARDFGLPHATVLLLADYLLVDRNDVWTTGAVGDALGHVGIDEWDNLIAAVFAASRKDRPCT